MAQVSKENDYFCTENLLCPSTSSGFWSFHYSIRYRLIRAFTCPIPYLPTSFPLLGGKSVLECICILGLAALAIAVSVNGGDPINSGTVCEFTGLAIVLLGLRNNLLTIILGISFERAIFFHRCGGILLLALSIIHGILSTEFFGASELNLSGTILFLGFVATSISYLVKRINFEVFYVAHVALYLLITVVAFIHNAIFLSIGIIFWAIDLSIRYIITVHKVTAEAEILSGNVIRIILPRPFAYSAGQYCFLMIPSISCYQFHPFSISSAPHQSEIYFHIRVLGDWTKRLNDHIKQAILDCKSGATRVPIDIVIEGPFGIPKINLESPYKE